jgi:hypothetical protein
MDMNPIIFFFFLGISQILIATIGSIVTIIITIGPRLRTARKKTIWACCGGAGGGFVCTIITYFLIIAVGLGWKIASLFHFAGPAIILAEVSPWVLMGGYILGLAGGSYVGWKIPKPVSSKIA